jgi:hypothetical protein
MTSRKGFWVPRGEASARQRESLSSSKRFRKVAICMCVFVFRILAALFKTMTGRVVTIRLLDPPLHEFLPKVQRVVIESTK